MARPTAPASPWATTVSYPAGADPWSATPIKVEPSAPEKAAGFAPEDQPPAQWLNWIRNNHAQWVQYQEELSAAGDRSVGAGAFTAADGATVVNRGTRGGTPRGPMVAFVAVGTSRAYLDMSTIVRRSATLTRARVAVDVPIGDACNIYLEDTPVWGLNPGFPNGTQTLLANTAAGTGGMILDSGVISLTMNLELNCYWLVVEMITTGGAPALLDAAVSLGFDEA